METAALKSPSNVLLGNILVRLLSFCVLVLLARFAYVVTVKGHSCDSLDFCFLPQAVNTAAISSIDADRSRAYYFSVFQELLTEGVLSTNSNSLCIAEGKELIALKEIKVFEITGISSKKFSSASVRFAKATFDFEFSSIAGLDRAAKPVQFVSEVSRILKPGGFFVLHTESLIDEYSVNSLLRLFDAFTLIKLREISGLHSSSVREIIFRKRNETFNHVEQETYVRRENVNGCSVPMYKHELIRNAEPLISEEPLKPWITLRRNIKKVKYLSRMVDISFKNRYIYIDVGSRSYSSSIGSWFKKQYPKQDKPFEIYAIEANSTFYNGYKTKKDVTLLPYAAWIRNETLFFEISREPNRNEEKVRGMGRIQGVQSSSNFMNLDKIQGFDFAMWLKSIVGEMDYAVVKMDVDGAEFNLIPRLIETGAVCLIDEIWIECHYNRWQKCCAGKRSPNPKHTNTYSQCLELFSILRNNGVLVHQWW